MEVEVPFDCLADEIELAWRENERSHQQWRIKLRSRLAEAQNWRCCYCGIRMDGSFPELDTATLEHVVPRSRGGREFDVDNLAVACLEHNQMRGDAMWPIHREALQCVRPLP